MANATTVSTPAPSSDDVAVVIQKTTEINITIGLSDLSTFSADVFRASIAEAAKVATENVTLEDVRATVKVRLGSTASAAAVREAVATATGEDLDDVTVVRVRRLAAGRGLDAEEAYEASVEASSVSEARSDMESVSNATALAEVLGDTLTLLAAPSAEVSSTVTMVTNGVEAIPPPTESSLKQTLLSDLGVSEVECAVSEPVFRTSGLDITKELTPASTTDVEPMSCSRVCAQISVATLVVAGTAVVLGP